MVYMFQPMLDSTEGCRIKPIAVPFQFQESVFPCLHFGMMRSFFIILRRIRWIIGALQSS